MRMPKVACLVSLDRQYSYFEYIQELREYKVKTKIFTLKSFIG